jgi:hypothetical protein
MPHFADPAWKEEFGATWTRNLTVAERLRINDQ